MILSRVTIERVCADSSDAMAMRACQQLIDKKSRKSKIDMLENNLYYGEHGLLLKLYNNADKMLGNKIARLYKAKIVPTFTVLDWSKKLSKASEQLEELLLMRKKPVKKMSRDNALIHEKLLPEELLLPAVILSAQLSIIKSQQPSRQLSRHPSQHIDKKITGKNQKSKTELSILKTSRNNDLSISRRHLPSAEISRPQTAVDVDLPSMADMAAVHQAYYDAAVDVSMIIDSELFKMSAPVAVPRDCHTSDRLVDDRILDRLPVAVDIELHEKSKSSVNIDEYKSSGGDVKARLFKDVSFDIAVEVVDHIDLGIGKIQGNMNAKEHRKLFEFSSVDRPASGSERMKFPGITQNKRIDFNKAFKKKTNLTLSFKSPYNNNLVIDESVENYTLHDIEIEKLTKAWRISDKKPKTRMIVRQKKPDALDSLNVAAPKILIQSRVQTGSSSKKHASFTGTWYDSADQAKNSRMTAIRSFSDSGHASKHAAKRPLKSKHMSIRDNIHPIADHQHEYRPCMVSDHVPANKLNAKLWQQLKMISIGNSKLKSIAKHVRK